MKASILALVLGAMLVVSPMAGSAQSIGMVGVGAALPVGANPDHPAVGFQLNGGVEFGPAASPVAFRLEALYDWLPFRYTPVLPCPTAGCSPQSAHESLAAATFDIVLRPAAPTTRLVPYFIAGVGVYGYDDGKDDGSTVGLASSLGLGFTAGLGLNFGVGVRLPFAHTFVEARVHVVRNAPDVLPIAFGIRF